MKFLVRLSWLTLMVPIGVFTWFHIHAKEYFPDNYETAFGWYVLSAYIAGPGILFLLIYGIFLLVKKLNRSKTPIQ